MNRFDRPRRTGCASALAIVLAGTAHAQEAPHADRLFLHGNVITPDGVAQAVAVRGNAIVAVGSDADVLALPHDGAEVVDLSGRTLMPGLYDMHVHVFMAGQGKLACKLPQGAGVKAIAAAVRACAGKAEPGAWIIGGSWVGAAFRPGEQTRKVLDAAAPNNPVLLNDEALHSVWVNSRALALAGVTRATPDPQGGRIDRDARGEPTGVLRELATRLVADKTPAPGVEAQVAAVKAASDEMLSYGIVGFTDAAVRKANVEGLSRYARAGGLKQHARGCVVWGPNSGGSEGLVAQRQALSGGNLRLDCVKLFLDGVPTESRTGAMIEPYAASAGAPAHGDAHDDGRGMLLIAQAELNALVTGFDRQGLEVKFHAAGDGATRAAVDAIAAARAANGFAGPRRRAGLCVGVFALHLVAHADHLGRYRPRGGGRADEAALADPRGDRQPRAGRFRVRLAGGALGQPLAGDRNHGFAPGPRRDRPHRGRGRAHHKGRGAHHLHPQRRGADGQARPGRHDRSGQGSRPDRARPRSADRPARPAPRYPRAGNLHRRRTGLPPGVSDKKKPARTNRAGLFLASD